jgi:hypothetical protein
VGPRDGREARDGLLGHGAMFEREGANTGWDADSGRGMQCEIMCGSCVRTRRLSGRSGASPSDQVYHASS